MFGWEFPPLFSGGLGIACEGLTKALIKHEDISIKFVLPKKSTVPSRRMQFLFADEMGFDVEIIKSDINNPYGTTYSKINHPGYNSYLSNLIERVEAYELSGKTVALRSDFDVIHAHDWLSFGAGIKAKEATGKPFIAHIHATEFDRGGGFGINQYVYEKEKAGFEAADKVIAVSEYTKKVVNEKYGIELSKIEVVHNGIEIEEIDHKEIDTMASLTKIKEAGYSIVLFLGRLTIQKNPEMILRAAKEILEHRPKTIFVFAGSGDMEGELIHKAVELGISDKVVFAGFVTGNPKHRLYRVADLFIMPSISEPFGIVPLESLANGTPAIVSKQSGVSEVINHALKVDFWDKDEIINKVVALLSHGPLKATLSEHGTREVHTVNWDRAADKVKSIYEQLV